MGIKYRSSIGYRGTGASLLDEHLEGGKTVAEALRIMAAALAGTSSKAGNTITIKGIDGVTDRIVGSFDSENNRTGAVLDGSE